MCLEKVEVGLEVARMLIKHGADVMTQNKDREAPLYLASCWKQAEFSHMLIEHGVDVTAQNKNGETPLHLAPIREMLAFLVCFLSMVQM